MAGGRNYLCRLSRKLLGEEKKGTLPAPLPAHNVLVEKAREELQAAFSFFNNVEDNNLIDCAIFKLNAAERRYVFLFQEARRLQGAAADNLKKEGPHREKNDPAGA